MVRTGRPREFDWDSVADAAVLLFWRQGYDKTSLADIMNATGLSSSSFYGAFGSKRALFEAALARFRVTWGRVSDPLADPDLAPRDAVEAMLQLTVAMQTDPSHPLGCMVALSGVAFAGGSEGIHAVARKYRDMVRDQLTLNARRAVDLGQLRSDTDAVALAVAMECFLWGITIDARDGVAREALSAAIDSIMLLWDLRTDTHGQN